MTANLIDFDDYADCTQGIDYSDSIRGKQGGLFREEFVMNYGLYLSAQGAGVQSQRLDVISNNLANAETGAFKRDLAVFQAHPPFDVEEGIAENLPGGLNNLTGGISLAAVVTDFSDAQTRNTGGDYDIALRGKGFFKVTDGQQEFLTRNGRLTVDANNELVLIDSGHAVVGADGRRITISPDARKVEIRPDGTIMQLDDEGVRSPVSQLDLVVPESFDQLEKMGNSLYRSTGKLQPAGGSIQVLQGHLEASGTRPVGEMMQLIQASRAFESNINMIRSQDESLGRLLQSLPRR